MTTTANALAINQPTFSAMAPPQISVNPDINKITLRLAHNAHEIKKAQQLRYKVFYEEFKVTPPPHIAAECRDYDAYDTYADHLVVVDTNLHGEEKIVGTYRMFRSGCLPPQIPFYSTQEFNINPLLNTGGNLLELGRSCVLPEYRTKHVMQLLWQGIADYLATYEIDLMFGCASFQETDPAKILESLSYLHHFHLSPANLCATATVDCLDNIPLIAKDKLDAKRVFANLPPLIKGYLRAGAFVGKGAFLDNDMKCIDVCIVMPTHQVTDKYIRHFERKIKKEIIRDTNISKNIETPSE